jgi:hypothetical protein
MNSLRPRDLFQALDGRSLSVSSHCWHVEIYGVFEQNGSCWVQLTLRGTPPYSVAVKIAPYDTATEILDVLSSWLAFPSKSGSRVLHFG